MLQSKVHSIQTRTPPRGPGRPILVVGATGKQGGAVARHLRAAGFSVRALTRNPSSERARALASLNVTVAGGDLEDPVSLERAMQGVSGVFSVQNFYAEGVGFDGEIRQGKNLVRAAQRAGVTHFVQSTMATAPGSEPVAHFQSKFHIEQAVDQAGLPRTFLGTVWFMDNLYDPKMGGLWSFPFLAGTLSRNTTFDMIAVDDVGAVVTAIFREPDRFVGQKIDVAGDRLTVSQMRTTFREVTGRRPPPLFIPRWLGRRLAPEFAAQLAWQESEGWTFSLEGGRSLVPSMRSFRDFLVERKRREHASR